MQHISRCRYHGNTLHKIIGPFFLLRFRLGSRSEIICILIDQRTVYRIKIFISYKSNIEVHRIEHHVGILLEERTVVGQCDKTYYFVVRSAAAYHIAYPDVVIGSMHPVDGYLSGSFRKPALINACPVDIRPYPE